MGMKGQEWQLSQKALPGQERVTHYDPALGRLPSESLRTQASNLRPLSLLHWQTGSLPLVPPGKEPQMVKTLPAMRETWVQYLGQAAGRGFPETWSSETLCSHN